MPAFYRLTKPTVLFAALIWANGLLCHRPLLAQNDDALDKALAERLQELGFTGDIEGYFHRRLGRPIDTARANLGRLLWFDTITGLHNDNTCAGCHSPTRAFGDTQSIAIGIDNNGIVGPDRKARTGITTSMRCAAITATG